VKERATNFFPDNKSLRRLLLRFFPASL